MSIGDLLELSRRNEGLEKKLAIAMQALSFYAGPWGIHLGHSPAINDLLQKTLNEKGQKARETLVEIDLIDAQKTRALEDKPDDSPYSAAFRDSAENLVKDWVVNDPH